MKTINIGIIGFGTVATGLIEGIQNNADLIAARFQIKFEIAKVAARSLKVQRAVELDPSILTEDAMEVVNNESVDVVLELMGGTTLAKDFVVQALKNGKAVVTANKALIAEFGEELFSLAKENKTRIFFEASVAGGVPIIKGLREGLSGNNILSIQGILNGTCNFILSEMEEKGTDFEVVVKLAQDMGYAEADPSLDVGGGDAAHKTAILASLAYGKWFHSDSVHTKGIDNIELIDIAYGRDAGYRLKLIGDISKNDEEKIFLSVQPTLVPLNSTLGNTNDVFNGIRVVGDIVGETMFYGQGAGKDATASAVYADLIDASQAIIANTIDSYPGFVAYEGCKGLADINERENRYYIRMSVDNGANSFAKVAHILGENQISLSSVNSKDPNPANPSNPVVLLTHKVSLKNLKSALAEIAALPIVDYTPVVYPIEDFA